MKILHKKTGELYEAVIELVEDDDWKVIEGHENFDFKWIKEKNQIVHKIKIEVEEEILGLVSIEDIPRELRIHVRLIEVNSLDRGKNKRYDYVAGCLFAFTCKMAFKKDYGGYVSLYPKTELIEYYRKKYGFKEFGRNMYVELNKSEDLINKYLKR